MDFGLQGSLRWLEERRKRIGASDAPIILCKSPWSTPYQLWLEKSGKVKRNQYTNYAIEVGKRWEPAVRARYSLETGIDFKIVTLADRTYPFIMASLDGYCKDLEIVLEIKCAGKEVIEAAKAGICHEKYYPQVQQQLYVTRAKECHFVVAKIEKENGVERIAEMHVVIVKPDEEFIKELLVKLIGFWDMIKKNIAPPLIHEDVIELDDQSSVILVGKMKQLKEKQRKAEYAVKKATEVMRRVAEDMAPIEAEMDEIREELIEHLETLGHTNYSCLGVRAYKNKNGTWVITVSKNEDLVEAEISETA